VESVISGLPLRALAKCLVPPPPNPKEIEACFSDDRIYGNIFLNLVTRDGPSLPYSSIWIPDPSTPIFRATRFNQWSQEMVDDPSLSALGVECAVGIRDPLWERPEGEILNLLVRDVVRLGLLQGGRMVDGFVLKAPFAVQTVLRSQQYRRAGWNLRFENMHRVDGPGMAHSMMQGIQAAWRIMAGKPSQEPQGESTTRAFKSES
jgi:hypothetical protein